MIRPCVLLLAAALSGAAAAETPCTTATARCTEMIPLGPPGRHSLIYRSFPLTAKNPAIRRAVVAVHGSGRNADSYFLSVLAGGFLAGALDDTLIISPRLASNSGGGCQDKLAAGEISWTCGGDQDWRRGGSAVDMRNVYTFDLLDDIMRRLARRDVFPNLEAIVVTGHSAGGQVVNRYAAANKVDGSVGVPVKYIVANPSSYLYLDNRRLASGTCSEAGGCTGEFSEYTDRANCTTYNNWHYGFERRAGYAASVSDEELRTRLVSRDVTYLLGGLDTLPLFGFDQSCPAAAQGPSRLARGLAYWNYLRSEYKAKHSVVVVPNCGHNGRCMYTAEQALPLLFPIQ